MAITVTDQGKGIPRRTSTRSSTSSTGEPKVTAARPERDLGFRLPVASSSRWVGRSRRKARPSANAEPGSSSGFPSPSDGRGEMNQHRILVVDDEPQIQRFLNPALTASGYEVIQASTGAEAERWSRPARRTWSSSTLACRTRTARRSSRRCAHFPKCLSSFCRPGITRRKRSKHSTSAPMTTSRSHSASVSCLPVSAPPSAEGAGRAFPPLRSQRTCRRPGQAHCHAATARKCTSPARSISYWCISSSTLAWS